MDKVSQRTILVTGGTGFIGKALCHSLTARDYKVIVLTRQPRAATQQMMFIQSLAEVGDTPVDIIINLAGEPIAQRWTAAAQHKIKSSRVETTAAIIDFIKKAAIKPALFISGSAIGYYGTEAQAEFDETSPPTNSAPFARGVCAAWEATAAQAQEQGVRTVFLRIGAVLEKEGGMLAKLLLPFRLGVGGAFGSGAQWLSWIDRDDLIKLMLHIIDTPTLVGAVNATAPHPVTNNIFMQTLAKILKRPCIFRTPAFVLRAALGTMAEEIMLEGQKVLPRKALATGFVFAYPHLTASLQKILKTENGIK